MRDQAVSEREEERRDGWERAHAARAEVGGGVAREVKRAERRVGPKAARAGCEHTDWAAREGKEWAGECWAAAEESWAAVEGKRSRPNWAAGKGWAGRA